MLKEDYLKKSEKNFISVEREIEIMSSLNHENIVKLIDHGTKGTILKKSGRKLNDIHYIILEHVRGQLLFDLCESMGPMGEDSGRFFLD